MFVVCKGAYVVDIYIQHFVSLAGDRHHSAENYGGPVATQDESDVHCAKDADRRGHYSSLRLCLPVPFPAGLEDIPGQKGSKRRDLYTSTSLGLFTLHYVMEKTLLRSQL
ncbi:hypothetical protein ACOMHN_007586 [Nucella lapillus]